MNYLTSNIILSKYNLYSLQKNYQVFLTGIQPWMLETTRTYHKV